MLTVKYNNMGAVSPCPTCSMWRTLVQVQPEVYACECCKTAEDQYGNPVAIEEWILKCSSPSENL